MCAAGAVHLAMRYGSKLPPLDKAGDGSVVVGEPDGFPGVIDALWGGRSPPASRTPT